MNRIVSSITNQILRSCAWIALPVIVATIALISGCQPAPAYSSEQYLADRLAEWNMKLYAATRDYIRTDTAARRIFNHLEPFPVWVSDKATCLVGFHYWNWKGWVKWMGLSPQGRDERYRVDDSLYRHVMRTRCKAARNPALGQLSTTDDKLYFIEFMHIDSTVLPNKYIVSAYLWVDTQPMYDSRDDLTGMMYSVVFDSDYQVIKAFSGRVKEKDTLDE